MFENNFNKKASKKTEYQFVKQVRGFEKKVNLLAQSGFRFLTGRRIGLIKYAVMAKTSENPTNYIFVENKKYQKSFSKKVKPSSKFQALFTGDSSCDSYKTTGGKLVFEQNIENKNQVNYKFVKLVPSNIDELVKLLNNDFKLLNAFYSKGITAILAK